eukprot:6654822-Prymnesium_polylepis.1
MTVPPAGTARVTTAAAPTVALSPISMSPRIVQPAPIVHEWPTLGWRRLSPIGLPVAPSVVEWSM